MLKNKQTLKKAFCATLSATMALTGGSFMPPGVTGTVKVSAEETGNGAKNLVNNPSFEKDAEGWFATTADNAKLEFISSGGHDSIGGYVKVKDRTDTWNSLAQDIKDKVKNHTKYNFSCWVKLGDEYTAESTVKAGLTINATGDNGGEDTYDGFGISNNTVTASKDEWRQIKGSFTANWNGELKTLQFKIADETCKNSFYVDNISITEDKTDLSIEKDIPSLKDFFAGKNSKYDFKVGGALEENILNNANKMELVQKHYNSVTAGNEMKPDYVIKGINDDGSLKLDFTIPDKILQYFWDYNKGKAEKDQIHIRGHVLCWHSQTPDFFFKDKDGKVLDKDAMNARLEEYIKGFTGHVQEKYPGLVYCWDVVNEAIIPSDGEKGGLRVNGGAGKETYYHQIYKDSNEYIINAFRYADKYVDKNVKLFYNDYGETDPVKVKCICDLADAIKAGGGRIDGIGMQAHYSMEAPSADELYNAVTEYGKHASEVQITELDMLASKSYDGSNAQKESELTKQAYRYKEFIDTILKAKDNGTNITAIVFWGVADDDSWLISDEFSQGRHNMPLLFDENLKAKPAYWGLIDPSRLSPYIKEENVVESSDKDWTLASPVKIGNNSSMKLLWSNEKLYVQVTVKDSTSDADDNVTIYLDKNNAKADNADGTEVITIKRSEATEADGGYVAEKEIAVPGKAANAQIGIDAVVSDATAGTKECWNDTDMKQAERSKYYGTLTLKPFMVINKGSANIDGEIDSAWNDITAHNLTVNSNKSSSTTGTVKSMWSEDYLYVLAEIKDAVLNKDNTDAWEQDSFEIFVDENNGKTGSYEADDCQYRINYDNELSFNGQNCNDSNIQSATKKTADGYIVEAKIKFNTVKGAENNLIGVDFQINDADASGKRVSTINWYDASGMGYAQPAVFGTAKLAAGTPGGTITPAPGITTEVKTDEAAGTVTEITTNAGNDKTTVTEKVTSKDTSSVLVTEIVSGADGKRISASASIYTGTSDTDSQYSAKTIIPGIYMQKVKDVGISSVDIYVEKVTVDIAKDKLAPKTLVKIAVPDTDGVSIGKVEVKKESIESARESGKKLVVKIQDADPSKSYTVTIPQSELKKMDKDINVLVKTGKVSGMENSSSEKVNKILASNKTGEDNSYTVTIATNNTKGGIKVTTPVIIPSAKTGDTVYAYRYNEKTGKLEEIPNSQRPVIKEGEAAIEGFSGNTYIITDKELSGKNVVTLIGSTTVSIKDASIKKGSKTKVETVLGTGLVLKPGVKSSVPYGKQAAVVTYKSSAPDKVTVSKDGTITAKEKGEAQIIVKIKLAGGKVKNIKKTIVVE